MATVNAVLQACTDAGHAALLLGQRLSPPAMKAEILRRYAELTTQQPELPPVPAPPPPTFANYYDQWLGEQSRRVNLRPGQHLSRVYLDSLANSLNVLLDFAHDTGHELSLEGMNCPCYRRFQDYFLQQWG